MSPTDTHVAEAEGRYSVQVSVDSKIKTLYTNFISSWFQGPHLSEEQLILLMLKSENLTSINICELVQAIEDTKYKQCIQMLSDNAIGLK